jgi:hypothetical protein
MQTGKGLFRRELNASVPANVESVLAFYRRELGKRGWKEGKQDGDAKADRVALAFSSPEGPATLKLGRSQGETSIVLSLKNPAEAQKAGLLPAAGQAKLILGNMGNNDVTVAINDKTIKVGAGVGGAKTPDGPMIDLRPGKYKYSVKAAGRPAHIGEIEVGADDAWGMIVAPAGNDALTMQLY